MKKIGIFYGSSTGNTEEIAKLIGSKLNIAQTNIFDIGRTPIEKLLEYDILFLGSSTLGAGDLQDDWEDCIDKLSKQNLSGKEVAVFGPGDGSTFSDTYCDAIAIIVSEAQKAGAKIVGKGIPKNNYSFDNSQALEGDTFCGLPLDIDNEPEKTEERVEQWLSKIKQECGI